MSISLTLFNYLSSDNILQTANKAINIFMEIDKTEGRDGTV